MGEREREWEVENVWEYEKLINGIFHPKSFVVMGGEVVDNKNILYRRKVSSVMVDIMRKRSKWKIMDE